MKLSDLKPCAACNGPLRKPPMAQWYVVRITTAMVNPSAANQVLGLTQMFNGALGLAEAMAPNPDDAVLIMGDKEPELMREMHICFDCFYERVPDLVRVSASVAEERRTA